MTTSQTKPTEDLRNDYHTRGSWAPHRGRVFEEGAVYHMIDDEGGFIGVYTGRRFITLGSEEKHKASAFSWISDRIDIKIIHGGGEISKLPKTFLYHLPALAPNLSVRRNVLDEICYKITSSTKPRIEILNDCYDLARKAINESK